METKEEKAKTKPRPELKVLVSPDQPLTIERAADYLGVTPRALYDLVYKKLVACYKTTGGRSYFHPKDLNAYAYRNRQAANFELEESAEGILNTGKKKPA
jgi:excisionase family DNA binding protein